MVDIYAYTPPGDRLRDRHGVGGGVYKWVMHVYAYDPLLDTLVLISHDPQGRAGNDASFGPHLDGADTRIVFVSEASNLVADDTDGVADVFVHEPARSHTLRVSTHSFGEAADGVSHRA